MYKRTWNKKYGKSQIFTKDDSFCQNVEIDMVRLAEGEIKSYNESDKEFGVLILSGKCTVEGDGFKYENIGERETVFDGNATCVYVPRNTDFKITGCSDVKIAVTKCPSTKDHKPVLIKPEDVVAKEMGKPGWERHAMFVLDERVEADQIYIGECWIEGGQWSSYPPHKHDDMNMPTEAATEEIYYYEFDKPQGFGVGFNGDDCYKVEDQGVLCITPMKTHQQVAAPGYSMCYVWMIRHLENDPWIKTRIDAPEHKWLLDV